MKYFTPEVKRGSMRSSGKLSGRPIFVLDNRTFETMSKRAWTDVLLQMYKVNCRYIYYQILRSQNLYFEKDLWNIGGLFFSKHIFKTKYL